MDSKKEVLFPYKTIRNTQDDLIESIKKAVETKSNLIIHAPTGLGKTVAALAPAIPYAMKNHLTIYFLTSRHTQHQIAINTIKDIKEHHNVNIITTDIIGKKWMCIQPSVDALYSNEFNEYCKALKEENKCEFYSNTKTQDNKVSVEAKKTLNELKVLSPYHTEQVIKTCEVEKLCPHEISTLLAKKSNVIIADYYYIFNPAIRNIFFKKAGKQLENAIIIVDEAHNLPKRCRELLTQKLTTSMLERALKEARKYSYEETEEHLNSIRTILIELANKINSEEELIKKDDFVNRINLINNYEQMIGDLEFIGDEIREKQKQSYIGAISTFLSNWLGQDQGYSRILTRTDNSITLIYRCLDPSLITKDVIDNAHSTILMSGTLTPTSMHKDILGFNDAEEKEYKSPFPKKNKLSLIIPQTTTKFTKRSEQQYERIAEIIAKVVNLIPGNSAIFFPSYFLRDSIYKYFNYKCKKTIIQEEPNLSKQDKQTILDKFHEYKKIGAVLLGVASGSFGEGVDLPGDLLKGVIVVGLPLDKPNLETKELINYYDRKFGKGWDYAYIFPAVTKTLQNAGRCIRSETDKGVTIFLDERYIWPNYYKCFPTDYDVKVTRKYEEEIKEFFENNS
ncbi:MAG: ATP-dependent DNA helicase [Candidatus Woesearchaeota archaeon]|nr:ATP-dependent DNA helicase [Candidatus Woesearchaeota archaeon]